MRLVSLITLVAALATTLATPAESSDACFDVPWLTNHGDMDGGAAVVLVHGFTGDPSMWDGGPVRQGVNRHIEPQDRSFADFIDLVDGVDAWLLDYSESSARWVTSDGAGGPRLLEAVECLHATYGTAVGIVGHSMGGLAARYVADLAPEMVGAVVTLGTPHTGSDVAAVGGYLLGMADRSALSPDWRSIATRALVELIQLCGRRTTESLDACGPFMQFVTAFDSDAGVALRTGSSQLAELATWPDALPTMAIAGGIEARWRSRNLFGRVRTDTVVSAGDLVVDGGSATALGGEVAAMECGHVLSTDPLTYTPEDWNLTYRPEDERPISPWGLLGSPCAHWNLSTTLEVVVKAQGMLHDHLVPLTDRIASARVPGICDEDLHPPTTLVDGVHTEIGPNDGYFELMLDEGGDLAPQVISSPTGDVMVVVAECNAGGVGWPNPVVAFDTTGAYHSHTFLDRDPGMWEAEKLSHAGRNGISRIRSEGDRLVVDTLAYARDEGGCCMSATAQVTVEAGDGELRVVAVDGRLNPASQLAYLVAGDDGSSRCAVHDVGVYLAVETAEVAVCRNDRFSDDYTYYARRWDDDYGIELSAQLIADNAWVARNGQTEYYVQYAPTAGTGSLFIQSGGEELLDEQGEATDSPTAFNQQD